MLWLYLAFAWCLVFYGVKHHTEKRLQWACLWSALTYGVYAWLDNRTDHYETDISIYLAIDTFWLFILWRLKAPRLAMAAVLGNVAFAVTLLWLPNFPPLFDYYYFWTIGLQLLLLYGLTIGTKKWLTERAGQAQGARGRGSILAAVTPRQFRI